MGLIFFNTFVIYESSYNMLKPVNNKIFPGDYFIVAFIKCWNSVWTRHRPIYRSTNIIGRYL